MMNNVVIILVFFVGVLLVSGVYNNIRIIKLQETIDTQEQVLKGIIAKPTLFSREVTFKNTPFFARVIDNAGGLCQLDEKIKNMDFIMKENNSNHTNRIDAVWKKVDELDGKFDEVYQGISDLELITDVMRDCKK